MFWYPSCARMYPCTHWHSLLMILKIWCPPTLRTHIQLSSFISKSLNPNGSSHLLFDISPLMWMSYIQPVLSPGREFWHISVPHSSVLPQQATVSHPTYSGLSRLLSAVTKIWVHFLLYLKQFSVFSLHIGSRWKSRVWPGGHVALGSSHSLLFPPTLC